VIQKRYKNTTLYSDVTLSVINDFSASLTFCQFKQSLLNIICGFVQFKYI